MALHSYNDAEKNFEFFMQNYPDNSYYPESIYQKGRLLFLQKKFESAIQVFYTYIELFKDTIYTANSYFWIGESLYSLGHFDDASKIFNHVLTKYPTSYKVEAAKYRISLIDLKKREDVLLDLIKMSHEEYLKTVEEFQIREKTYEQAINAYQKKYASFATLDSQEQINELNNELIMKNKKLQSFKDTITELNNRITSLQSKTESSRSSDITSEETINTYERYDHDDKTDELLKIKTEISGVNTKILTIKNYYDNKKVKSELGIEFISTDIAIKDTLGYFKENNN